jgi:hypothetical protein
MYLSPRVRRIVRSTALTLIGFCAFSWLCLYLDSIYERRRAEHLIAELKSFPFSTAGFTEVRDFVNRYGGVPLQRFSISEFPVPGMPQIDSEGRMQIPLMHGGPTCTVQDCTFEVLIRPRLFKLMTFRTPMWVLSGFAQIGFRPWGLIQRFEIENGKLRGSQTSLGQERHAKLNSFEGLIPMGYEAESSANSPITDPYRVGMLHITGGPMEILKARLSQTPNTPLRRAFDIDLRCFTAVLRACRGFEELAPSAWADYQVSLK